MSWWQPGSRTPGLRGLSRRRVPLELPRQRVHRRPLRPHHSPLRPARGGPVGYRRAGDGRNEHRVRGFGGRRLSPGAGRQRSRRRALRGGPAGCRPSAGASTASCRRTSSGPNPRSSARRRPPSWSPRSPHPNGWERDTAARLLYERRDPKAVPLLSNMLAYARSPLARVHALHALDGLGALDRTPRAGRPCGTPMGACGSTRCCSLRSWPRRARSPTWSGDQLRLMSADPSVRVRYQLAFTVGELHRQDTAPLLAAILLRGPHQPLDAGGGLQFAGRGCGEPVRHAGDDARVRNDPIGQEWLRRLAAMIGVKGLAAEVAQVFGYRGHAPDPSRNRRSPCSMLWAMVCIARAVRWPWPTRGRRMQPFYAAALSAVQNYGLAGALAVAALQLLGVSPYTYRQHRRSAAAPGGLRPVRRDPGGGAGSVGTLRRSAHRAGGGAALSGSDAAPAERRPDRSAGAQPTASRPSWPGSKVDR